MPMDSTSDSKAFVPAENRPLATLDPARPFGRAIVVPKLVSDAGDRAARRFANFFGFIENDNTRAAYSRACALFFAWCDGRDLTLPDIEPIHVGDYVKILGEKFEKPTVKQHLAAIKMLFDWLVVGQVVAIKPAHAVRGPKHVLKRGKTPVLTADQAREPATSPATAHSAAGVSNAARPSRAHASSFVTNVSLPSSSTRAAMTSAELRPVALNAKDASGVASIERRSACMSSLLVWAIVASICIWASGGKAFIAMIATLSWGAPCNSFAGGPSFSACA